MIVALVLIPALAGIAALLIRSNVARRLLLVATACVNAVLTVAAWVMPPAAVYHGWFALDRLGLYFLSITGGLFLAAAVYAVGYLVRGGHDEEHEEDTGFLIVNAPEAVFTACLLFFLSTMTLVTVSQHFGLLWVAVEATTLSSAPLIYFHRSPRSLEATWKYLLICSVGIALALLGNFFLAVSGTGVTADASADLTVAGLQGVGPALHVPWLKAAWIFFLVGYGTKMGLAPMHTWLPDAHSESPSVVSALLSGALLNCAFLGILRVFEVCSVAGLAPFAQEMLVGFGLLSMGVAAVFVLNQVDYKRMLAYSSVEHMGILALGVGLGGAGTFGAMLHAVNHSMGKALLFFAAGNILGVYKSKRVREVRGVLRVLPMTGVLWVAGFLAITGSPPFGAFLSEFVILKAALDQHHWFIATAYLLALGVIFIGMASVCMRMAQGVEPTGMTPDRRCESWTGILPAAVLAVGSLVLGLYLPSGLATLLQQISTSLGGR